jgi:hypothetical protein
MLIFLCSLFLMSNCHSGNVTVSGGANQPQPITVQVSVTASDPTGNQLTYRWKATEGSIVDVNAPSTTWTLPHGPGLHFAYVLVSNGKGGYTERRVAVNTDTIGTPAAAATPVDFDAPAAPAPTSGSYRSVLRGSGYYSDTPTSNSDGIYLPDTFAYLLNTDTSATTATAATDVRGSFTIDSIPTGTYSLFCSQQSGTAFAQCSFDPIPIQAEAVHDPYQGPQDHLGRGTYVGRVVLNDGAPCGTVNEFFGKTAVGQATLLDLSDNVLAGPYRLNAWGHYGFDDVPGAAKVLVECEGASPQTILTTDFSQTTGTNPRTVLSDTAAPVVTSMSAKLNGSEVGLFLPPPTGLPSNNMTDAEFFLSFKGIDTRMGACQYYRAVGAVKSCDAQGVPSGAITFDDWKRKVKMEPYAAGGAKDIVATFINRVDLNLTRNHHSLSYGTGQAAAYVCNHLGPTDEKQAAADLAIENAVNGRNLIACVAMDHGVTIGVNGDKAFTRYLIFGPSGQLLLSVNLDGRREKFVPGVCVACHGGDRYVGRFPENGTGFADIGAHFLPYDSGNFTFSTKAGYTQADLEPVIHALNMNVLEAGPNIAITELIEGWYSGGTTTIDHGYVPSSWLGRPAADIAFYKDVYARSCRTCHVAFTESLNFDHYANMITQSQPVGEDGMLRTDISACDGSSSSFVRNFSMPNSLRTLDLFWGSAGMGVDQPAILSTFLTNTCSIRPSPNP